VADIHIEDFYKDTAVALVQLYGAFPRRVNLFAEDIAGPDEPDEFGLHSNRHMACFGALLWLAEEGFMRHVDIIRQEALDQAVLTHRAFVRLSAPAGSDPEFADAEPGPGLPPAVRDDFSTHIHLIRKALKSGSSERISRVMQAVFFRDH
jgi:hypothetical protein